MQTQKGRQAPSLNEQKELLPVVVQNESHYVDARLLHNRLQSKQEFSTWIKNLLSDYYFKEGEDFLTTLSKSKGRPSKEYLLTFDTAKELGMLSKSEKGREIRQYFIAKEKELRGISQLPKEQGLFKGLKPKRINNSELYPYREILERCGYKRNNNGGRTKRYWQHFVKEGNLTYITKDFALHLYHQRQVANNRAVMLAAQPVLALEFYDAPNTKGGKLW